MVFKGKEKKFMSDKYIFQKIDEEDGRLVEAFLSKDAAPQPTLADIIEFLPERGNPDRSTVEYFNGYVM